MQTSFTPAQLADPDIADADKNLRTCVHCGFCTATCPTYVLLGDELDSPRGRIYLIKGMLERDEPATAEVVKHIDRCLSCLSCMTTCPSGVHYQHLIDHARAHVHKTYRRPLRDRLMRRLLTVVLPRPFLFRLALLATAFSRPVHRFIPSALRGLVALAPRQVPNPSPIDRPGVTAPQGQPVRRVSLLAGCAQQVLAPQINEATVRLLTRHGVEVTIARGAGCCGALVHHLGDAEAGHAAARANIDAWWPLVEAGRLDALVINASGCGTQVKDYGFMLRNEPRYAEKAARISSLTRDVTEFVSEIGLMPATISTGHAVTYHAACSMQHGQKIKTQPKALLARAGFVVREPAESHLCCGSAGTYNILQPEIAGRLRDRKIGNIARTEPEIIATGNIGCMTQLATGTDVPIVHTVELLDWATGGPVPDALSTLENRTRRNVIPLRVAQAGLDRV